MGANLSNKKTVSNKGNAANKGVSDIPSNYVEKGSKASRLKSKSMNCVMDTKEKPQAPVGDNDAQWLCMTKNTLNGPLLIPDVSHEMKDEKRQELKERIFDMHNKEVACQLCQDCVTLNIIPMLIQILS